MCVSPLHTKLLDYLKTWYSENALSALGFNASIARLLETRVEERSGLKYSITSWEESSWICTVPNGVKS